MARGDCRVRAATAGLLALACGSDDATAARGTDAATTTTGVAIATSDGAAGTSVPRDLGGSDGDRSTGATDGAGDSSSSSGGGPVVLPDPPPILMTSPTAAAGGWLFALADTPLGELALAIDGTPLTELDAQLPVVQPIGVWRVPDGVPPGARTLSIGWADHPSAATLRPIEITAASFVDVAGPTGLAQVHDVTGAAPECAQSHTGLALADIDDDGRPDLYVGNVGVAGRLHRNLGDVDDDGLPDFEDVTDAVGLGDVDAVAMATFVDLDGDGDQDLFVGRRGSNRMFDNRRIPDGEAAFVDVTDAVGLGDEDQRTMGAAFGDYDGDGDLDLYVVNHTWCFPTAGTESRAGDHLYRNDGGVFVERTADLSPTAGQSAGFSAVWVDLERDGDPDLVVINDDVGGPIGDPNEVWRNDGPDRAGAWAFTEVGAASGVAIAGVQGMGLAADDVDGDGFVDLAFSNRGANVLLLNAGDGTFVDVSAAAGIERALVPWDRPSVTWATHLWDHDNDGDVDLYFTGGPVSAPVPMPDAFFDNQGDGSFVERTWESGLADPGPGKGSLLGDLDRDGAWDLVTASWGAELRVWRNVAVVDGHHFVDVALRGRAGNRDALGAIVELTTALGTQTCFHGQRPALGAGGDTACHFGLGAQTDVLGLRITWPDGTVQDAAPPPVDARTTIER